VAPEVYENYLKGWFATSAPKTTRAGLERGKQYFQAAIDKDPSFAPAYLGLAVAYDNLGSIFIGEPPQETLPKENAAVEKALALDPDSADAHAIRGYLVQLESRWGEAESEYRLALKLKPNDASIHAQIAEWLVYQGRSDEGVAEVRRAREMDPLAIDGAAIGWILLNARRSSEAVQEYRSALAVHPDDVNALWGLAFALMANQQPEQAVSVLQKTVPISNRSSGILATLAAAYAQSGNRSRAVRLLAELNRRRQSAYVPAGAFVYAYVGLGDRDQAFVWLERAREEHSHVMPYLKAHPFFDPLRGDSRFADLLRRTGLN
jgi:Tfp pilus assembly protein PilF